MMLSTSNILSLINHHLTDDNVLLAILLSGADASNLRVLIIDNNLITQRGIELLITHFPLTSLSVKDNNINDAGLILLIKSKTLLTLDIGNNAITDLGVSALD